MFDPVPLPAALAEPEPGADAWAEQLGDYLVELADEDGSPLAAAAVDMVADPDNYDGAPEEARRWTVTDDGAAEWAMRHVAAADDELLRLQQQSAAWVERIAQWYAHVARPLEAKRAFMVAHLERYALRQREESDGKAKRVVLPSGAVTTTARAASVRVADEDAVLTWARANAPEAVTVTERVRVSDLRSVVKPVRMVTSARLTLSCGCCVLEFDSEQGVHYPDVGSEIHCSTHDGPALLGRVEELASRWQAVATTTGEFGPPGVEVDAAAVTARVVPA